MPIFSDKLNLKIQLNCNQQSKWSRKSLASLGARSTIGDSKGTRECAGFRQDTGALLFCPQHEWGPNPLRRAPSQLPPFPKVLLVRQHLAEERTLDWSRVALVLVLSLVLPAGCPGASYFFWSCCCSALKGVGARNSPCRAHFTGWSWSSNKRIDAKAALYIQGTEQMLPLGVMVMMAMMGMVAELLFMHSFYKYRTKRWSPDFNGLTLSVSFISGFSPQLQRIIFSSVRSLGGMSESIFLFHSPPLWSSPMTLPRYPLGGIRDLELSAHPEVKLSLVLPGRRDRLMVFKAFQGPSF